MDLGHGTVIAGRYLVEHEIGRGGMGAVYRVEHVHTSERFALKVLTGAARSDPMALQRFRREAKSSAAIKSDYVVKIIDADVAPELDGAPFLVMELLDGIDLERRASENGPIAPEILVPLLAQVASALDIAHRAGIVHRDIKPENLFVHRRADGSTIAKILDFGISKMTTTNELGAESTSVTTTGVVIGTPLYMAPEQARGQRDKIGPSLDIWAMGHVAMRLLVGEHFWGRPTMPELMVKLVADDIPPPSKRWPDHSRMSPALDAWFARSCARDPAERWTSVGNQIAGLANALGQPLPERAATAVDDHFAPSAPKLEAAPAPSTSPFANTLPVTPREKDVVGTTPNGMTTSADPASVRTETGLVPESTARPARSRLGGLAIAGAVAVAAVAVAIGGAATKTPAPSGSTNPSGVPLALPDVAVEPSTTAGASTTRDPVAMQPDAAVVPAVSASLEMPRTSVSATPSAAVRLVPAPRPAPQKSATPATSAPAKDNVWNER